MNAIEVDSISKRYRLGMINRGMLYQDLESYWARLRGKPDPHAPLNPDGSESDRKKGEFWALKNVSFELPQGEAMAIIGKNGSGKSTLLKIISQITAPTSGKIRLRGRVASMLEVGTGFHSELTGRSNVFINGAILGMSKREIESKFDEIVAFAGVEKFIDTPVKRYSSGMSIRLAFAVAAHLIAEIMIIDEVLAVGDAEFQRKCLAKLAQVVREGRTILFVSHNMQTVRTLCSRALLLESGVATRFGPADEVIRYYLRGTDESYPAVANLDIPGPSTPAYPATVRLLDAKGELRAEIALAEPWQIEVDIIVRQTISDLRVQVNLNDSDNICVAAHSTVITNLQPLKYRTRFAFDEKLRPGEYRLSILTISGTRVVHVSTSPLILRIDDLQRPGAAVKWYSWGGLTLSKESPVFRQLEPVTEE